MHLILVFCCFNVQLHDRTGRYTKYRDVRVVPVNASSALFHRLLSCHGKVFPLHFDIIYLESVNHRDVHHNIFLH